MATNRREWQKTYLSNYVDQYLPVYGGTSFGSMARPSQSGVVNSAGFGGATRYDVQELNDFQDYLNQWATNQYEGMMGQLKSYSIAMNEMGLAPDKNVIAGALKEYYTPGNLVFGPKGAGPGSDSGYKSAAQVEAVAIRRGEDDAKKRVQLEYRLAKTSSPSAKKSIENAIRAIDERNANNSYYLDTISKIANRASQMVARESSQETAKARLDLARDRLNEYVRLSDERLGFAKAKEAANDAQTAEEVDRLSAVAELLSQEGGDVASEMTSEMYRQVREGVDPQMIVGRARAMAEAKAQKTEITRALSKERFDRIQERMQSKDIRDIDREIMSINSDLAWFDNYLSSMEGQDNVSIKVGNDEYSKSFIQNRVRDLIDYRKRLQAQKDRIEAAAKTAYTAPQAVPVDGEIRTAPDGKQYRWNAQTGKWQVQVSQ